MRVLTWWVVGTALLAFVLDHAAWGSDPTAPAGPRRVVAIPRQYRVQFVPAASPTGAEELLHRLGLRIVRVDEARRLYVIRVPEGVNEAEAVRGLRQSPLVAQVSPDVLTVHAKKPVGPPPPKHPQP